LCVCDADTDQASDIDDTSLNESANQSQVDTSVYTSADEAKEMVEAASPVTETAQTLPPKVASPVQQQVS